MAKDAVEPPINVMANDALDTLAFFIKNKTSFNDLALTQTVQKC
jgi:hypothetical protein